ncbi:MAG: DUF418 domain-containing protein [Paracoccaceae bacterium]|jgi:uncharacterized protein|nr:DUF418 domain-containing protein [Paracoccaceae bacterium]MDP7187085.1 DUF418 domain-containing protein [Paracoccaceae bacterium]
MTISSRALMPDYLRLFALFGIVVVNVLAIAFSFEKSLFEPAGETLADAGAVWMVYGIALMKSYGLFSFMFGVGLGFLMQASERKGLVFGKLYRNRMIGLLLLGLAHGFLFFPGDILVTYAVFGAILYFMRNWPVKRLVWVGAIILAIQIVIVGPVTGLGIAYSEKYGIEDEFLMLAQERAVLTGGTFWDAVAFRTTLYLTYLPLILLGQGFVVLGWFCLGLAAVKAEAIDDAEHRVWRRARRYFLVPGVLASLFGAWAWQFGDLATGMAITTSAAPVATIAYLGVIAALSRPPGPFMKKALAAGGNSLSIYLGQSIILSTVFSAYGLGLWDSLGHAEAILLAILVTVALMGALSIWRRYFAAGPFEWVLRRLTYAGTGR